MVIIFLCIFLIIYLSLCMCVACMFVCMYVCMYTYIHISHSCCLNTLYKLKGKTMANINRTSFLLSYGRLLNHFLPTGKRYIFPLLQKILIFSISCNFRIVSSYHWFSLNFPGIISFVVNVGGGWTTGFFSFLDLLMAEKSSSYP